MNEADEIQPLRFINMVGNSTLDHILGLVEVTETIQGIYGVDVFPASVSHGLETKCTIATFRSGELGISGTNSKLQSIYAALKITEKLSRDFKMAISCFNLKITNMVADCKLGFKINRRLFYHNYRSSCNWEAQSFDGLAWRTKNPDITFIVSENGSIIAAGLKNESMLSIVEQRLQIFKEYQLGNELATEQVMLDLKDKEPSKTTTKKYKPNKATKKKLKVEEEKQIIQTAQTTDTMIIPVINTPVITPHNNTKNQSGGKIQSKTKIKLTTKRIDTLSLHQE